MHVDMAENDDQSSNASELCELSQFTKYSESQINTSQETLDVLINNDKDNKSKEKKQRIYMFADNLATRNYQELAKGHYVSIINSHQGIIKLSPLSYSQTAFHACPIEIAFLKGVVLCSINSTLSRHKSGDIVMVPKGKCAFFPPNLGQF